MHEQKSINDILKAALLEIRDVHGVAIGMVSVGWTGTIDRPKSVVTETHIEAETF